MAEEGDCQTGEGCPDNDVEMRPQGGGNCNVSDHTDKRCDRDSGPRGAKRGEDVGDGQNVENMQEDSGLGDELAEGTSGKYKSGGAGLEARNDGELKKGDKMEEGVGIQGQAGAGHGVVDQDREVGEDNKNSEGESVVDKDPAGVRKRKMKKHFLHDLDLRMDEEAPPDGDDERESETGGARRRERNGEQDRERPTSGTDEDADVDDDDEDDDGEEDTAFVDELLKKPYPKPTWHPVVAHSKRQRGGYKTPWAFRRDVIGSHNLVQRFEQYAVLDTHEGCVNTLHFNQSGDRLASGSDDLKIALWDWACKKTVLVYDSGHKRNVFQAKFMPNSCDTTIVSCARDGQVRVGALSSTGVCKDTRRVAQHKAPAHKLALELDSPVVFMSCGEDAIVWNVDLREPKPHKAIAVKDGEKKVPLYTIHINPSNKNEFIVGGRDKYIRVYDRRKLLSTEDEAPLKRFCPHRLQVDEDSTVNVTCSVYSYNGQEILVSYNDDDIYLFDNNHSDGSDYIHRYQGHRNNATVKGVNFYGARSEFVVSGSDCGNVFLWSKDTERIVQLVHGDEGGVVNCLEPHPTAPILATSGLDHNVKIWMPTSRELADINKQKKTLMQNRSEREEERHREPSHLESQMFRFLLHHLRRSNRRQAREEGDDLDSDDSSSEDEESDSDEEDDDERAFARQMACNPS